MAYIWASPSLAWKLGRDGVSYCVYVNLTDRGCEVTVVGDTSAFCHTAITRRFSIGALPARVPIS